VSRTPTTGTRLKRALAGLAALESDYRELRHEVNMQKLTLRDAIRSPSSRRPSRRGSDFECDLLLRAVRMAEPSPVETCAPQPYMPSRLAEMRRRWWGHLLHGRWSQL
jgi:hypothetical protein